MVDLLIKRIDGLETWKDKLARQSKMTNFKFDDSALSATTWTRILDVMVEKYHFNDALMSLVISNFRGWITPFEFAYLTNREIKQRLSYLTPDESRLIENNMPYIAIVLLCECIQAGNISLEKILRGIKVRNMAKESHRQKVAPNAKGLGGIIVEK